MKNALSILALSSVALLTACGGGGGGSYGGTTMVAPAAAFAPTAVAGTTSVDTATVTFTGGSAANAFVTATSHEAVYTFNADAANTTTPACTAANGCLAAWPAVPASASLSAGFGTVMNGTTAQLTFMGHPLYTFAGDSTPGVASGNGDDVLSSSFFVATQVGSVTSSPGIIRGY
jgi:predicted lipoprotein with Yx(FWY)xxD motif